MKKLTMQDLGFETSASEVSPRELVTLRALKYAQKVLREISVIPGNYMGNQRCYQNTRNVLEFQPQGVMASCIAFIPDRRGANLHFLNKNEDGTYTDNTLGYQARVIRYFLIKEYTKDELDSYGTHKVYAQIIDDIQDKHLNLWFTPLERKKHAIGREHF